MSLLWSDALDPDRAQVADRIHLIADADLDPRLRNALLVDLYCDLSEDVAAVIYGLHPDPADVRPNFYSYAMWGAHTVGVQLRRTLVPGARRRGRALEAGNAAIIAKIGDAAYRFRQSLADIESSHEPSQPDEENSDATQEDADTADTTAGGPGSDQAGSERGGDDRRRDRDRSGRRSTTGGRRVGDSFLAEETCGLPHALLIRAQVSLDDTVADAISKFRDRGIAHYRAAAMMRTGAAGSSLDEPTRRERDRQVLLGNVWLATAEQCLIQDHIAAAARVNVRRWLTPPLQRLTVSQRDWRNRRVAGLALRAEHWFGRSATRWILSFHHAPGAVPDSPRAVDGGLAISRWYRAERQHHQADGWSTLGSPFELIDEVETVDWWPGIRQRLAAIHLLMATTHERQWFDPHAPEDSSLPTFRNRHRPGRWRGSRCAVRRLRRRLRSPAVDTGGSAIVREAVGAAPRVDRPEPGHHDTTFTLAGDWPSAIGAYGRHQNHMFLALFARSLPASFCSPSGAAVLDPASVGADFSVLRSAESMIGDAFKRLGGTARGLDRFFSPDEAERELALRQVRRMHDHWRKRIDDLYPDGAARPLALCDPVGNEQILGTACTFVTPVHDMFEEFRVPAFSDIDWDAWARVWCDIAVAQGADPTYVAEQVRDEHGEVTYESLAAAARRIENANRDRTYGGVRLMANLLRDLRDGLPHWSRNSFLGALAIFGEQGVLDLLLVSPRPERRWARPVVRVAVAIPAVRTAFWWWVDRAVGQVRELVDGADQGSPLLDLDRVFPGHTEGVTELPLS